MNQIEFGVLKPKVKLVSDEAYLKELKSLVAHSMSKCLCSLFIVDLSPMRDEKLIIDSIFLEMQAARWRGVDVRLLIGGSRTNLLMAEISDAARTWANQLQIPCRWLTSKATRGSHMKLVIADSLILTGSHNWSAGALTNQSQDSIIVSDSSLAAYLEHVFEAQWARAGLEDGNV